MRRSTTAIDVVNGPRTGADPATLERWCGNWSGELGVELRPRQCSSPQELVEALTAASDALGAVVNPGEAAWGPVADAAREADRVVAWVDLEAAETPRPPQFEDPAVIGVRGRGVLGYRWAVLRLLQRLRSPCSVVSYGDNRDQVGDLRLPEDAAAPLPVAVLLHGGFWRERWERDTIEPLAIDLSRRGYASWNLEYRRVGPFGGGWPETFADVAAGIDHLRALATEHPLDLDRVVLIGHSAGGHLALWAVSREGVAGGPAITPALVVSLAGIGDLAECARRGVGDTGNAAEDLMGGPQVDHPAAYSSASPQASLPLGVPQLIVQGDRDNTPDLVDMNAAYVEQAGGAGDDVEMLLMPEADHFDLIDPESEVWRRAGRRIDRLMALEP